MMKMPEDRINFYVSILDVSRDATDKDIFAAFPESYVNNAFPIEGVAGGFDLQFKDRNDVIKAMDCHEDSIRGEPFTIAFSELSRQQAQNVGLATRTRARRRRAASLQ